MTSVSEHVVELARELLDDIDLRRQSAEAIVLKASRPARLTGSEEIRAWLRYEMLGYNSEDPIALEYMDLTGRWIEPRSRHWILGSCCQWCCA